MILLVSFPIPHQPVQLFNCPIQLHQSILIVFTSQKRPHSDCIQFGDCFVIISERNEGAFSPILYLIESSETCSCDCKACCLVTEAQFLMYFWADWFQAHYLDIPVKITSIFDCLTITKSVGFLYAPSTIDMISLSYFV